MAAAAGASVPTRSPSVSVFDILPVFYNGELACCVVIVAAGRLSWVLSPSPVSASRRPTGRGGRFSSRQTFVAVSQGTSLSQNWS